MNQSQFRQMLKEEFLAAQVRRPGYSLRAFAMRLHVSPSVISEIFSGKRKVSVKMAHKILEQLHISPDQIQKVTQASGIESANLNMDQFNLVAEWHHMAILELVETKKFQNKSSWIAKKLGISTSQVELALERLLNLGLLENVRGKLQKNKDLYISPDGIPSVAVRKWHRDHLEKSIQSLNDDAIEDRDFVGLTFAVNKTQLPHIKKKIRQFLEKIMEELDDEEKNEVYQMNFQLVPITKDLKI